MKIPINILDRTKLTDILITAEETLDVILDMKEGGCVAAEYVNSYREMDWSLHRYGMEFFVKGVYVCTDDLSEQTPILLDSHLVRNVWRLQERKEN